MNRIVLLALVLTVSGITTSRAVTGQPNNTTDPGSSIPNWDTGWGNSTLTGWDYVGQVANSSNINIGSGVYLGNGWVLTAGHLHVEDPGAGGFTLDGVLYAENASTVHQIENGTVDLTLYQIVAPPSMPELTITSTDPTQFAFGTPGSQVAFIGYGGGSKSWGFNTVTKTGELIQPMDTSYENLDFLTATGTTTVTQRQGKTTSSQSVDNLGQVVPGDSGGGAFIFNTATQSWDLAGINEVSGTLSNGQAFSGFVELGDYFPQIEDIIDVPEPSSWLLLGLGAGLFWFVRRHHRLARV